MIVYLMTQILPVYVCLWSNPSHSAMVAPLALLTRYHLEFEFKVGHQKFPNLEFESFIVDMDFSFMQLSIRCFDRNLHSR